MTRKQYQDAFSHLEPSQAVVDAALQAPERRAERRRSRVGGYLLAAALTVMALAGTAFAAVHFHWFTVQEAQLTMPQTQDTEKLAPAQPTEPQKLIKLDAEPSDSKIGFTLPERYLDGQDTFNSWMLEDGLYRRYYRNADPNDPASPLLTVEIVYDRSFLTRADTEIVKEGELGGLQTVWLKVNSTADGRPQYCLFQRNDDLGCFVMIASTESFTEAEQAAADLCFVDTGAPVEKDYVDLYYGLRVNNVPEGLELDDSITIEERGYLANATLAEGSPELSSVLYAGNWICRDNPSCSMSLQFMEHRDDFIEAAPVSIYKTGSLAGHPARWVNVGDGNVRVELLLREEHVQITVNVFDRNSQPFDKTRTELPVAEQYLALAEELLKSAEVVPIEIEKPAPGNFTPFAVG